MSGLTSERRAEIAARAEAASPGPWAPSWTGYVDGAPNVGAVTRSGFRRPEDADFVAHARTDVPDLLAALDATVACLQALWGVTIVGHQPGDACPYQVGHSPTEHVVFGLGVANLDAFVAMSRPPSEGQS
jgi:hypothetical protein